MVKVNRCRAFKFLHSASSLSKTQCLAEREQSPGISHRRPCGVFKAVLKGLNLAILRGMSTGNSQTKHEMNLFIYSFTPQTRPGILF